MSSKSLDGAASKDKPAVTDPRALMEMPARLAATPESIAWTPTRHERSAALRHNRIAVAAYMISEARGFEPGHEAEDWLAAQIQIDAIDAATEPK